MHGQFLQPDKVSTERFFSPQFSFCATTLHGDIRMTSMEQTAPYIAEDQDLPWDERDDDRLFWRGSPTGMRHTRFYPGDEERWRYSQRIRLVNWTSAATSGMHGLNDKVEYLRTPTEENGQHEAVGAPRAISRQKLNRALMDIAFAGEPIFCRESVCDTMKKEYPFGKKIPAGRGGAAQYKYLLDVDGNGWSARFRRLMSMDAVVFKATIYPEWWIDRIEPWVHYVPVQMDYSDIYDILVSPFALLDRQDSADIKGSDVLCG